VKTALIALSAAALMAATPAGFARDASGKSPSAQHPAAKKRHPGVVGHALRREMQARGSKQDSPTAFGYVPPRAPMVANPDAGGGGGGGSGM